LFIVFFLTADNGIDLTGSCCPSGLRFVQQGQKVAVSARRYRVQLAAGDFRTATHGKIHLLRGPVAGAAGQQDQAEWYHSSGAGLHFHVSAPQSFAAGRVAGSVFHLMEPDINQEIYGLPGYLSAIPSALLNESATLFRRKYYLNGSHAGFIMYMTDPAQSQQDVDNIRGAMKSAKGPGNFRNLFM